MVFEECPSNKNNLRRRRRVSSENCCSVSSTACPRNEGIDTSCDESDFSHDHCHHQSGLTTPASVDIERSQKDNNRRPTKPRLRHKSSSLITSSHKLQQFLLVILLLLNSLTLAQQQGFTIGNVLNLDRCYAAMQDSQINNLISRFQYVGFVQILANNQFQSFQYDEPTNSWGNFPTKDFNSLPEQIRAEFNSFACGGANFFCDDAYLYTNGTAPGDPVPDPQQEVYLYQVCEGVESAIDETLPKTMKPTGSPTTAVVAGVVTSSPTSSPITASPVVEEKVVIDYQIVVPSYITEGGFENGDNDESEELKEALLAAVQTWMQNMASDLSQGPQVAPKKQGRVLGVTIDPEKVQFTNVTTAGESRQFSFLFFAFAHSFLQDAFLTSSSFV